MTAVDTAIDELVDALNVISPQLEGLLDFERLNIESEARAVVQDAIADYAKRVELLQAAIAALVNLNRNAYPGMPVREISPVAYADLFTNTSTVEAALKQFSPLVAGELSLFAGEVEPK